MMRKLLLFALLLASSIAYAQRLERITDTVFDGNLVENAFVSGIDAAKPAFFDWNGDGKLDLVIGNRTGNLVFVRNDGTNASPNWTLVEDGSGVPPTLRQIVVSGYSAPVFTDLNGDGDQDLLIGDISSLHYYANDGTNNFSDSTTSFPLPSIPTFAGFLSPVAANVDNDQNGTVDLIIGLDDDRKILVYRNTGTPNQPQWTAADFLRDSQGQIIDAGLFTAPAIADLDEDGDLDLLIGNIGGQLYFYRNVGNPVQAIWHFVTSELISLPNVGRTSPVFTDFLSSTGTPDGLVDIILGTLSGQITSFRNNGGSGTIVNWQSQYTFGIPDLNFVVPAPIDTNGFTVSRDSLYRANGLLIGSNSDSIRFYLRLDDIQSPFALSDEFWDSLSIPHPNSPFSMDLDEDGDEDLAIGSGDGYVFLYENVAGVNATPHYQVRDTLDNLDGRFNAIPVFLDNASLFVGRSDGQIDHYNVAIDTNNWTIIFDSKVYAKSISGVFGILDVGFNSAPTFTDFNGDSVKDLLVGSLNGDIRFYANQGTTQNPLWVEVASPVTPIDVGSHSVVRAYDWDLDGDDDLFIGNSDGEIHYFENNPGFAVVDWEEVSTYILPFDVGHNSRPFITDLGNGGQFNTLDLFISSNNRIHYYEDTDPTSNLNWEKQTSNYQNIEIGDYAAPVWAQLGNSATLDLHVSLNNGKVKRYIEGITPTPAEVLPAPLSGIQASVTLAFGDLFNGDGVDELCVGVPNQIGGLYFFRNKDNKPSVDASWEQISNNSLHIPPGISFVFGPAPALSDVDQDGDVDLILGQRNGEIWILVNRGSESEPDFGGEIQVLSLGADSLSAPALFDLSGDSYPDIVTGESQGSILVFANEDLIPPPVPQIDTVTVERRNITLHWSITNPPSDLSFFNIYRSVNNQLSFIKVAEGIGRGDSTWTDTSVTYGTKYFYAATSVDLLNNESEYSNIVSATPYIYFVPDTSLFSGVIEPHIAWIDFDEDNDLDIFLSGKGPGNNYINRAYANQGEFSFVENPAWVNTLPPLANSEYLFRDFDNDGDADLIVVGNNSGQLVAQWFNYQNQGWNLVPGTIFTGLEQAAGDCGDFNRDGFIDVILSGKKAGGIRTTEIYLNQGGSGFKKIEANLEPISIGDVAVFDMDNDGWDDVVITGESPNYPEPKLFVYRNTTSSLAIKDTAVFQLIWEFEGVKSGKIAISDFVSDSTNSSYLDILVSGELQLNAIQIYLFRNDGGSGNFNEVTPPEFFAVSRGIVDWNDLEVDGDPDVYLSGHAGSILGSTSAIFENRGTGWNPLENVFPKTSNSGLGWADINTDGHLDALISGDFKGEGIKTKLYIYSSDENTIYTPLPPPQNLVVNDTVANDTGFTVRFEWEPVSQSKLVSYNVAVRRADGVWLTSFLSDDLGNRRVAATGNAGYNTFFEMRGLPKNLPLLVKVQAVDQNLVGGAWSDEVEFQLSSQYFLTITSLPDTGQGFPVRVDDQFVGNTPVFQRWRAGDTHIVEVDSIVLDPLDPDYRQRFLSYNYFADTSGISSARQVFPVDRNYRKIIAYYLPQVTFRTPAISNTGLAGGEVLRLRKFPRSEDDWETIGDTLTLIPQPDIEYRFAYWMDKNDSIFSTQPMLDTVVTAPATITAYFELLPQFFAVEVDAEFDIPTDSTFKAPFTANGEPEVTPYIAVMHKDSTLILSANSIYQYSNDIRFRFSEWENNSPDTIRIVNNLTSSLQLKMLYHTYFRFRHFQQVVDSFAQGVVTDTIGGTVTISPNSNWIIKDTAVELKATPKVYHEFFFWKLPGSQQAVDTLITISMDSAITIGAVFKVLKDTLSPIITSLTTGPANHGEFFPFDFRAEDDRKLTEVNVWYTRITSNGSCRFENLSILSIQGNEYSTQVPHVEDCGLIVRVQAIDFHGNRTREDYLISARAEKGNIPSGVLANWGNYAPISIPLSVDVSANEAFPPNLEIYSFTGDSTQRKIENIEDFSTDNAVTGGKKIQRARGYLVYNPNSSSMAFYNPAGIIELGEYELTLKKGYNLVGSPYTIPTTPFTEWKFANIQDSAFIAEYTIQPINRPGVMRDRLLPWEVYCIYSPEDKVMTIQPIIALDTIITPASRIPDKQFISLEAQSNHDSTALYFSGSGRNWEFAGVPFNPLANHPLGFISYANRGGKFEQVFYRKTEKISEYLITLDASVNRLEFNRRNFPAEKRMALLDEATRKEVDIPADGILFIKEKTYVLLLGDPQAVGERLEELINLPREFRVYQNYPNPFNNETIIKIDLPKRANVAVDIYNVLGQRVKRLVRNEQLQGRVEVRWDGTNDHHFPLASGLYFIKVDSELGSVVRKTLLVK